MFCLLTALQFHGLTTQLPRQVWIAMPRGSHPPRIDSHLFITVLAYQLVQVLRRQLGAMQNRQSWNSLRATLSVQRRVTATFRQKDGRTLNIRKSTRAEPELADIYSALNINPSPGGVKKLVT